MVNHMWLISHWLVGSITYAMSTRHSYCAFFQLLMKLEAFPALSGKLLDTYSTHTITNTTTTMRPSTVFSG